jgi:hypothetical protein
MTAVSIVTVRPLQRMDLSQATKAWPELRLLALGQRGKKIDGRLA